MCTIISMQLFNYLFIATANKYASDILVTVFMIRIIFSYIGNNKTTLYVLDN